MTPAQRDMLLFLRQYVDANGCSPSYAEIGDAIGVKSKSGVSRLVEALEDRGYLRREGIKKAARALVLTDSGQRMAIYAYGHQMTGSAA